LLQIGVIGGIIALLATAFLLIDLTPDLSRLDTQIFSGSTSGNYYAVASALSQAAQPKSGRLENVSTHGSVDNLKRLRAAQESCAAQFALVQDGLMQGQPEGSLELIGRLADPESVFFLGKNAASVQSFADLADMRIGIGPEGSGTAALASQLFAAEGFDTLNLQLSHHSSAEQLDLLETGELDLAMFVIQKKSAFIGNAVRERNLQIAGFREAAAVASWLPSVRAGVIPAGFFDPVQGLPQSEKTILEVDTLLVGNGCASRSVIVGFLSLVSSTFPDFMRHNRATANETGLQYNAAAKAYFDNNGPEFLDEHVPWLADIIPLSNLVTLAMAVSILFNIMGAGHRFRLWRIDANRIAAEQAINDIFSIGITPPAIRALQPTGQFDEPAERRRLDGIVTDLKGLLQRCRKHSTSMLVPMGQEMAYRYQENIIIDWLAALQDFRRKIV